MITLTKVLHLCLASFYIDNYSYQENLLPKYHKKMGLDVEIIASMQTFDENGSLTVLPDNEHEYINENGIKVTRLEYKPGNYSKFLRRYTNLNQKIKKSKPEIIFVHGSQFCDINIVNKYVEQHPSVRIFVDNHADYSNSARSFLSKYILHRILWKHCARLIEPRTSRFWGVLPARVDFLVENYGLPRDKCSLLVMGADDAEVERASSEEVRKSTRKRFGFRDDDFIVVTGGKIDKAKKQIFTLIKAIEDLPSNVKLLVFGPIIQEYKDAFASKVDGVKVVYIPWASTSDSYDYFAAADLVVFPGRHSVYWEQAAGMGKPLVVKRWQGTEHVNVCGNVKFIDDDEFSTINNILTNLILGGSDSYRLLVQAAKHCQKEFLYSDIAIRSLYCGKALQKKM